VVTEQTGEAVTIDTAAIALEFTIQIDGSYSGDGHIEGLLGNDNGNPANDFELPKDTILTQPLTQQQLYTQFGAAWRVSDPDSPTGFDSLLDYGPGQNTSTFTDPSFPPTTSTFPNCRPRWWRTRPPW
jgi:hypothetical protein